MKIYSFTCVLLMSWGCFTTDEVRSESPIHFDLPPTAVATDTGDASVVTVELRLSSMIDAAHRLNVDQWIVRCEPRDHQLSLVDYAPRTETASQLDGSIQIKSTNETSNGFGASIDGGYGRLVTGHAGIDQSEKQIETQQYDRVAPHQVVVAAGTIHRGRGVYFKLRSTERQVLEGEKKFSVTLRVPSTWRGGLMDVSVEAQTQKRSINPWDRETKTICSQQFVVAVYRDGDQPAEVAAESLAEAERALRALERQWQASRSSVSLSAVVRHVAMTLDVNGPPQSWLQRLLIDQADPHLDKQIRHLPMNVRVAVLDYAERRDDFHSLNRL
ncbi:hypothetical protein N9D23_08455 [Rubripirellula sp.]|jgi:hypothetical protein|nr:hypothetical protein [Planctomycetaceae bacterium]MDA9858141.1 hypothetical protein [Rubripirellula sp.]MDF1840912.1 hypothetical protein [Rubripirellula sp.]